MVLRLTADQWIALGSFCAALGVAVNLALVLVAWRQLRDLGGQFRRQGEREKRWKTVSVCESFSTDPVLSECQTRVWNASSNGTDYSKLTKATEHDILAVLNYLDAVAIGVAQGIYEEEIVFEHFKSTIPKVVPAFILKETGTLPNGIAWVAAPAELNINKHCFNALILLYEQWLPHLTPSTPVLKKI